MTDVVFVIIFLSTDEAVMLKLGVTSVNSWCMTDLCIAPAFTLQ